MRRSNHLDIESFSSQTDPIRMIDRFGKWSIGIGILLIIIGLAGIFLPSLIALQAIYLTAFLFIVGGTFWLVHAARYSVGYWSDWLKPVLLLISGLLLLLYPAGGLAAIGLLLAFYLLLDAFGSFTMAMALRPFPGWKWMTFNGAVSLLLALLFLIDWPQSSIYLIGLFISISLLLDGIVLTYLGWVQQQILP